MSTAETKKSLFERVERAIEHAKKRESDDEYNIYDDVLVSLVIRCGDEGILSEAETLELVEKMIASGIKPYTIDDSHHDSTGHVMLDSSSLDVLIRTAPSLYRIQLLELLIKSKIPTPDCFTLNHLFKDSNFYNEHTLNFVQLFAKNNLIDTPPYQHTLVDIAQTCKNKYGLDIIKFLTKYYDFLEFSIDVKKAIACNKSKEVQEAFEKKDKKNFFLTQKTRLYEDFYKFLKIKKKENFLEKEIATEFYRLKEQLGLMEPISFHAKNTKNIATLLYPQLLNITEFKDALMILKELNFSFDINIVNIPLENPNLTLKEKHEHRSILLKEFLPDAYTTRKNDFLLNLLGAEIKTMLIPERKEYNTYYLDEYLLETIEEKISPILNLLEAENFNINDLSKEKSKNYLLYHLDFLQHTRSDFWDKVEQKPIFIDCTLYKESCYNSDIVRVSYSPHKEIREERIVARPNTTITARTLMVLAQYFSKKGMEFSFSDTLQIMHYYVSAFSNTTISLMQDVIDNNREFRKI